MQESRLLLGNCIQNLRNLYAAIFFSNKASQSNGFEASFARTKMSK